MVSQLALAVPMCLLYEVGIWAAQMVHQAHQAGTAEEEIRFRIRPSASRGRGREGKRRSDLWGCPLRNAFNKNSRNACYMRCLSFS